MLQQGWKNFSGNLTGPPRWIYVNFHVISTYFLQQNFAGRKIHVFLLTFFHVILIAEKSMLFPRTFIGLSLLVKISTLFPRTFLDVISLLEICTLFLLTFFEVILIYKSSTLFSVSCELMKTLKDVFLVFVAWNCFQVNLPGVLSFIEIWPLQPPPLQKRTAAR